MRLTIWTLSQGSRPECETVRRRDIDTSGTIQLHHHKIWAKPETTGRRKMLSLKSRAGFGMLEASGSVPFLSYGEGSPQGSQSWMYDVSTWLDS